MNQRIGKYITQNITDSDFFYKRFRVCGYLTVPEPKGAYGVGTVNVELSDPAWTQLRSHEKRTTGGQPASDAESRIIVSGPLIH
jgi:hypothetical protein